MSRMYNIMPQTVQRLANGMHVLSSSLNTSTSSNPWASLGGKILKKVATTLDSVVDGEISQGIKQASRDLHDGIGNAFTDPVGTFQTAFNAATDLVNGREQGAVTKPAVVEQPAADVPDAPFNPNQTTPLPLAAMRRTPQPPKQ